jgi:hypothetical protein
MLPFQSLLPLVLLALLMLGAALYSLAALGHFPRTARQPMMLGATGSVVLWGSIAAVTISVLVAIATAAWLIPWYAAIIAAGIAVLIAPLVLQYFSDDFVDGRRALLWFSGAALAPAIILGWVVAH